MPPTLAPAPPDQARGLRKLVRHAMSDPASTPSLKAIAVTGGKGGVGKTCVAVNLAVMLARLGLRPLLADLDLGLANADLLLDARPERTLSDVLLRHEPLASVLCPTRYGIDFVPAASGHDELTRLGAGEINRLLAGLGELSAGHDLLVLDTAAGIGNEVLATCAASRVVLVLVTPDPTALTDAYALIKLLEGARPGKDIRVLVNQAANLGEAQAVYQRLRTVALRHLGRDLTFLGDLPSDPLVAAAVRRRRPFAAATEEGPAGKALRSLAQRLKGESWR